MKSVRIIKIFKMAVVLKKIEIHFPETDNPAEDISLNERP